MTMNACVVVQLLLLLLQLVSADSSADPHAACGGNSWFWYSGLCYKWFESPDYWHSAEVSCRSQGGHLASARSRRQNTLIGRLTVCQSSWIGLYSKDVLRLNDPGSYGWTDGGGVQPNDFHRHNFTDVHTNHQPLITADWLEWKNNYYHDRRPFVCSRRHQHQQQVNETAGCQPGWVRRGDHCLLQPEFKATYIEASYYCDGRDATLASARTNDDLTALHLLGLQSEQCLQQIWLGLVQLRPCRPDYRGQNASVDVCFRWQDTRLSWTGFPKWSRGHPQLQPDTRCVVLKGRQMVTVPCHTRLNFVCQRPAQPDPSPTPSSAPSTTESPSTTTVTTESPMTTTVTTESPSTTTVTTESPLTTTVTTESPLTTTVTTESPTSSPPLPIALAAVFDFGRSRSNLASPGRQDASDWNGVTFDQTAGAQFNGAAGSYLRIGVNATSVTSPLKFGRSWTIFYRARVSGSGGSIVEVADPDTSSVSLRVEEQKGWRTRLELYSSTGRYFSDVSSEAGAGQNGWSRVGVSFDRNRVHFYREGRDLSRHHASQALGNYKDNDGVLLLGNSWRSPLPSISGDIRCFGVAHRALTSAEILQVMRSYCG